MRLNDHDEHWHAGISMLPACTAPNIRSSDGGTGSAKYSVTTAGRIKQYYNKGAAKK